MGTTAGQGAAGGSGGESGAGGSGNAGSASGASGSGGTGSFDREALDPTLRALNPEQINELFTTLVSGLRGAGANAGGGNAGGGEQQEIVPTAPDREELKKYF